MSALSIQVPFPVFNDRDGQPLDNGYVWIGVPNLPPQTNPVTVYFDDALTILAPQPLRTINGYISRAGSPAQVYIDGVNFSILVQDSKGSMVYNFPDGSGISPDACGVTYNPPFTGAVSYPVCEKLEQTVSVQDFGAVGDGDYTTGTGTDNRAAIQAAYDYCVANGKSLHLPAGSYRCIGRVYFGDIFTPTPEPLFDANGVTVYGDGRDTIIWTDFGTGADVININNAKNLTVRDLAVTSRMTDFSGAGSNAISITNGFDNINVLDVYCFNLPYVEKPLFLDGGKGVTIQPGTATTSFLGTANIRAHVVGCVHGFGIDCSNDLWLSQQPAVRFEGIVEDCYHGVLFSATALTTPSADDGFTSGVTVNATAVNCQNSVLLSRMYGAQVDVQVVNTKSKADRTLNPNGTVWKTTDTIVYALLAQFVKNSQITVTGYAAECDYKVRVGAVVQSFGATTNSQFFINLGGPAASIEDFQVITTGAGNISNCTFFISTTTAASIPADLYLPARNNTVTFGPQNRLVNVLLQNPLGFAFTDGISNFTTLERDGFGVFAKQTGGTSNDLAVLGVKDHLGNKEFFIRNDGAIATQGRAAASAVGTLIEVMPIYDSANVLVGYVPVHATYTP